MESLNLTTPITSFRLLELLLDWEGAKVIVMVGLDGSRYTFQYNGSIATTLMTALNKTDLSTKSLQRRVLERLVADGYLSGTITGSPD